MKKNEKNFVQNEADLENVAGGIIGADGSSAAGGGVNVANTMGDVSMTGYQNEEANETKTNITTQQNIKFGDVSGGVNNFSAING